MTGQVSPFAPHIARVLAHKHALGIAYHRERRFFAEFERATIGWPDGGRPHRLTVVRALARFLAVEEPRTFVPPSRFLGIRRRRPPTRVLSREEASRFLSACDALPDAPTFPRGRVYGTACVSSSSRVSGRASSSRCKIKTSISSSAWSRCGAGNLARHGSSPSVLISRTAYGRIGSGSRRMSAVGTRRTRSFLARTGIES